MQGIQVQDLYCHMHDNYCEAVVGNESLRTEASKERLKQNLLLFQTVGPRWGQGPAWGGPDLRCVYNINRNTINSIIIWFCAPYLPSLVDNLCWYGHVGLHTRREVETCTDPLLPSWHTHTHTQTHAHTQKSIAKIIISHMYMYKIYKRHFTYLLLISEVCRLMQCNSTHITATYWIQLCIQIMSMKNNESQVFTYLYTTARSDLLYQHWSWSCGCRQLASRGYPWWGRAGGHQDLGKPYTPLPPHWGAGGLWDSSQGSCHTPWKKMNSEYY